MTRSVIFAVRARIRAENCARIDPESSQKVDFFRFLGSIFVFSDPKRGDFGHSRVVGEVKNRSRRPLTLFFHELGIYFG